MRTKEQIERAYKEQETKVRSCHERFDELNKAQAGNMVLHGALRDWGQELGKLQALDWVLELSEIL